MSGEILPVVAEPVVFPASNGSRSGMLLNILQCTEQSPENNYTAQLSVVPRLREQHVKGYQVVQGSSGKSREQ